MNEWVLTFPAPAEPLSMNDKDNRSTGRDKQAWRDTAYYRYIEAFPGIGPKGRALPPAEVFMVIPFATQRRRDSSNWIRTVKACVDGIQRAGAWPDDTDEFVTQHVPKLVLDPSLTAIIRIAERKP